MDQELLDPKAEFAAMHTVYDALKPLSPEAQARVIGHVAEVLGLSSPKTKPKPPGTAKADGNVPDEEDDHTEATSYKTFAELFDAAQPQTTAQKALVAGYWLQVCEGAESFDGQRANKELTHLGHKVPNITNAISTLNSQKPSLAIQLKKSGTSQQARKTYKITTAGETAVKEMIHG
jgi:hypothetical protein